MKRLIPRDRYLNQIRPFIGTDLVKVLTGIRRCGKSVMLELIQAELRSTGVLPSQLISINFEDLAYAALQNAQALYDVIVSRVAN